MNDYFSLIEAKVKSKFVELFWFKKKQKQTPTVQERSIDFDSLPHLLTIEQVSEILGVHPNTLRNWDRSGRLRAVRIGIRQDRRYDREAIRSFYQSLPPHKRIVVVPVAPVVPESDDNRYVLKPGFSWRWFQLYFLSRKFSLYIFSVLLVAFTFAVVQVSFFAYIYLARAGQAPVETYTLAPSTAAGWDATAAVMEIDALPTAGIGDFTDDNAAHFHALQPADQQPVEIEHTTVIEDQPASIGEVTDAPLDTSDPILTVGGFRLPDSVDPASTISEVALAISLAAQGDSASDDVLVLEYSADAGQTWMALESMALTENFSNAIHGDFFIYPLPDITSIAQITQVRFRATFASGSADAATAAWIDGVTVRATVQEPDPVIQQIEESTAFVDVEGDGNFALDEQPVIDVTIKEGSNFEFLGVEPTTREIKNVAITDPNGTTQDARIAVTESESGGDTTAAVTVGTGSFTRPGKYSVTVAVEQDGRTKEVVYEFVWGGLAMNTDQAQYRLGQDVTFSLGAVDDTGHIVCTADMLLRITDPQGTVSILSSADGSIAVTDYCSVKDVYEGPDYVAVYTPTVIGRYSVELVAAVQGDERRLTDSFTVAEDPAYYITRQGPTRVFPNVPQPMTLRVHARDDFAGIVRELIPGEFTVEPGQGGRVEPYDTGSAIVHSIVWEVDLAAGSDTELTYAFKSPEKSPALFAFGPAQVGEWQEARAWQLVIDPAYMFVLGNSSSAPTGWTTDTTYNGYYPRGAASTDATPPSGGATSHTHTVSGQTISAPSTEVSDHGCSDFCSIMSLTSHTHGINSLTVGSANNDPLNYTFYLWKSNSTDPTTIPNNAFVFFDTTPSGSWSQFSSADDRMVKINNSHATGGTANTHTHSLTWGSLTAASGSADEDIGLATYRSASFTHTHTAPTATNSTSYTSLPSYIQSLIYQATADNSVPQNMIAMWDAAPPTGWTTVSGASQTYNGQFIRGSSSYSATPQSADTHSMANQTSGNTGTPSANSGGTAAGTGVARSTHTHTITASFNASTDHKPQYFDVILAECTNASGCGAASGISIGGSLYSDEGSTKITASAKTIVLWVNGNANACGGGACTAETSSGDYTIANVTASAGDVITIFVDEETEEATTVFKSDGTTQTNAHLYQNRVIVRNDYGASITNANLESGDREGGDSDVKFDVASSNLTVDSNFELHLWTGDTYDPNGTVTTQGTGSLHVDDSATMYLDTATNTIAGSTTIDTGATLNVQNSTNANGDSGVTVTGTLNVSGGTFAIGDGLVEDLSSTGTTTLSGGTINIADDLLVSNGTTTISTAVNVWGNGTGSTIAHSGGTLIFDTGASVIFTGEYQATGGTGYWSAGTITGDTANSSHIRLRAGSTTYLAGASVYAGNNAIVEWANTTPGTVNFYMTGGHLYARGFLVYNTATLVTGNGLGGAPSGGTLHLGLNGGGDSSSRTYYDVQAAAHSFYNFQVDEDSKFNDSTTQTLNLAGSFIISSGKTFNGNDNTMAVTGDFTNNGGTYTGGTSTVQLVGNGAINGTTDTTFYNLTIGDSTVGTVTVGGSNDVTVTNTLNIDTDDVLSIGSDRTVTHTNAANTTLNGTVSGAGRLVYPNGAGGPGTTGTLSAITRYDATSGDVASTTIDARTYAGPVEFYSSSSAGTRTATLASGTYTLSGSGAHFHVLAAGTQTMAVAANTNNPTVTIGGDLDFTGTGGGSESITSGTGTWTVSNIVDFTGGTYTATSGNTLAMDGDDDDALYPNGTSFYNFSLTGFGTVAHMQAGNMTVTNTLSIASLTQLDIASSYSATVASTGSLANNSSSIISGDGTLIVQASTLPASPSISANIRLDATSNDITVNGTASTRTLVGSGKILELYNNSASSRTITLGDTAGRTFSITGGVTTTRAGAGTLTVQVNTYDPTFTITQALTIGTGTVWEASNTGSFDLKGDYTNNGTFTDNLGTVTLSGTAKQTLSGSMTTSTNNFYNLILTNTAGSWSGCSTSFNPSIDFAAAATISGTYTITTGSVEVEYNSGSTYTVNNINWAGSVGNFIVFRNSNLTSGTWLLNVSGTQTAVSYVDVARSDASSGSEIGADDGTNTNCGTNTNWNFGFAISGTANGNEGATVRYAYNSTLQGSTTTISSGTWTISGVTAPSSGDEVYVWIDNVGNDNESTAITIYDGSGHITGMVLDTHVLTIGSDDNPTLTDSHCTATTYQNVNDEDIMFSCWTSLDGPVFTVDDDDVYADDKLRILSGSHLDLTGSDLLEAHDVEINGQLTPAASVTVSGSWDNNGDYNAASETITFESTTTETIDSTSATDADVNTVVFNGSGGQWTLNSATTVNSNVTMTLGTLVVSNALNVTGNITANGGTIQGTSNITVLGDFSGNGTVNMTGGTVEVQNTSTIAGNTNWTFYNLTAGYSGACTASYTMTAQGSGEMTVSHQLTSESCSCGMECAYYARLATGDKIWHFTGSGTGTGAPTYGLNISSWGASTFSFEGTAATDVYGGTLYNLRLDPASGTPSYTLNGGSLYGDLYIDTLVSFSHTSGTALQMAGDGKTIDAGGKTFYRVYVNGTNNTVTVANTDFTTSNYLIVSSGSTLTINSGRSVTTGSPLWLSDGTINGAGLLVFTDTANLDAGGTLDVDVRLDATAGPVDDTLFVARAYGGDLELYNNSGGSRLFEAGAGTLTVSGNFSSNSPSGSNLVEMTPPTVTITGSFTLPSGDSLQGWSSMSIGGNMSVDGNFSSGTATITLNGTSTQTITGTLTGVNSFYDLIVTNASVGGVVFSSSTDVDGTFTATTANTNLGFVGGTTHTWVNININGQAVGTRIDLARSSGVGSWNLVVTGTQSVRYANPSNSSACGGDSIRAYDGTSNDGGSNNCWIFTGVTVSGAIYSDQGSTLYNCSANNITIHGATNGESADTATCTSGDGTFSISVLPPSSAGDPIILYIDSGESIQANFVTLAADTSSAITGARLYDNWIIVRHENAGPMTNADMLAADNGDAGVIYYDAGYLQLDSGRNLLLWSGDSFDPGGKINTGGGSQLYLEDGSEMWFDAGTTYFSGGITIANVLSDPAALHVDATSMTSTVTVNGTMDGTGDFTILSSLTGNGTVAMTGGTMTFPYTSTIGGAEDWSFSSMEFTHASCGSKTSSFTGAGSFTFSGTLTTDTCFNLETWTHVIDPNDKLIILTMSSGTPMDAILAGQPVNNSIVRYTGTSVTVDNSFYSTLQLQPSSSTTYTLQSAVTTIVYSNMTVNSNVTLSAGTSTLYVGGASVTLDLNDETLYNLDVYPSGTGTVTVQNTDFSVSNTMTVDTSDTLSIPSGRTVTLNSTGSLTLNGVISGAGRLAYRPATAFPTTGTISSILRFDCTNNNTIMSDRTYGGDVEFYMPGGASRQVTIGTAGSQTPDITGNLTLINSDFDFLLTADASGYDPSVTIGGDFSNNGAGGITTIGAGAGTWTVGGDVELTRGQFIPDTGSTLIMNGTGTLFVDNVYGSDTSPYNFQTSGSGTITLDDPMTVSNDMVVGSGTTVTGAQNLTVTGGDITGDGILNLTAGTLTIPSTSGSFGGDTAWSINNFHLSSTTQCADRITTATGTGQMTVTGVITTDAVYDPLEICGCTEESCYGHALHAGSKTWVITQGGTGGSRPVINNGRIVGNTSTFRYTGEVATDIQSLSNYSYYYNLHVQPSGGATPAYTFTSPTANSITHDLVVGDGSHNVHLNAASNNAVITVGNDLSCTAGASTNSVTTGTATWTVTGNTTLSNCDTFTATAGHTLLMNGASKVITSGGKTLSNFQVGVGSVSSADAMDVNGTFTVSSGSFTHHASSNLNVAGDFTIASGATFNPATSGLLILDGDLTYADNRVTQTSVGDVHIGTSPDTTDLATDMTAKSLTINDGDVFNTHGYDLDIGIGGITIAADGGSGGGRLDVDDDVETDGTYMATDGKFDLQSGAQLNNSDGTNVGSTLAFTIPATAVSDVTSDLITAGTGNPYDLVIDDGGGTYDLTVEIEDPLTVENDITITDGILDTKSTESNAITIGGDWTNADTFTSQLATATFTGAAKPGGTIYIDSSGAQCAACDDFFHVVLNDSANGDTFQLESNLDVNGNLTITGGTLDTKNLSNYSVYLAGNWTNNDIFEARSGTVTADGINQQTFSGTMTGASAFYNLTITNSSGSNPETSPSVIFSAAAETDNNFTATTANTKLRFNAGSTYTFQNISFNGQATGTRVFLRSSSTGTQWDIHVAGTRSVSNTNVRDSDACGQAPDIDASNGTNFDATNNDCWLINSMSFSISDTTIGFGSLSATQDRYATGDGTGSDTEVQAHTLAAATSGGGGYSIDIDGTTLTSGAGDSIDYIGGTNTASQTGTEQYGIRATASGGSGSVSAPYADAGFAYDLINFPDTFATSAGASSTTTYSVRYMSNISSQTEAGNYTSNITYIITPEF